MLDYMFYLLETDHDRADKKFTLEQLELPLMPLPPEEEMKNFREVIVIDNEENCSPGVIIIDI